MSADPVLDSIIRKLTRLSPLGPGDCTAVRRLTYTMRTLQPPAYLVREGEPPRSVCSFVVAGFAYRQKLTAEGSRQIVALQLPGDFLDLQHLFLDIADHNVQALTQLQVADVSRDALQEIVLNHPAVGRAMWIDELISASMYREWVLNIGRRSARARIAHILCEFAVRMRAAHIGDDGDYGYDLPMTQEQLGDAVGLTSVHVNRTLKGLVGDGLIRFDRRRLSILDWDRIRQVGEFSSLYLHLDQVNTSP